MKALVFGYAALAGLLNAVQAGCNAALGKAIGPFVAGLVVLGTSAVLFIGIGGVSGRLVLPTGAQIAGTPWWAWFGGVFGAMFVMAQLFTAEQLGSAVFMAVTVTAAVTMSLALDHFGLVGFKEHAINAGRIGGALLMFAGLGLIAWF